MSLGLDAAQKQRAVGAVVGMAVGDALGAGYEGDPPRPGAPIDMIGGGYGPFAPGEWTDDTSMAIPILDELARGGDLLDSAVMDRVAQTWAVWAESAPDVGAHTRLILETAPRQVTASGVRATADERFAAGHSSAGNGTLMRTTPIALGYLDDPAGLTAASRAYALMTHGDPDGAEACVLWNHAQREAILTGHITFDEGLRQLDPERAEVWAARIAEAQAEPPEHFHNNGWVIHAFQAAWSAVHHTPVVDGPRGPEQFADTLITVVRAGGDTDTVAAIAGGLLGARWGVSAIPSVWRRRLHGWPDRRTGQELLWQAALAASAGESDGEGWPTAQRMDDYDEQPLIVQHPHDDGVWIGNMAGLDTLPAHIEAVVSLCRVGTEQVPERIKPNDHVETWLIDSASRLSNPNLEFTLLDAAKAVQDFRTEGRQVFLHCVRAHSRTPTVAAVYSALQFGHDPTEAFQDVERRLPTCHPQFGRVHCHVALGIAAATPAPSHPTHHGEVAVSGKPSVLFVCVHNAGRSQMAAGYLTHLSDGRIEVRSAGSAPGERVNPSAVIAMAEEGIDLSREFPKVLSVEAVRASDVVITMGCGDACPIFPGKRYEDWVLDDPAGQGVDTVRAIRDEIRGRVEALIGDLLGDDPGSRSTR